MVEKDIGDRAIGRIRTSTEGPRGEGVEALRQEAAGIGRNARTAVENSLNSARHATADNVRRTAEALHAAAADLGQEDTVGGLIDAAAAQLDSASDALRGRDLGRLAQDVNDFARRQPALFIGGALLAGIALGRFATAGMRRPTETGEHHYVDTAHGDEARSDSGAASRAGATGPRQEGRLSGAIGGPQSGADTGEPPATIPGHQARGARPQMPGSASGMPADE